MQFSPSIFKAYDIRGVVPATVNEEMAQALGLAFGIIARREGETSVAVGRDGRLSGPALSAALVRGLVAAGVDVIDIGAVTTPMLYFAASTLCSSGIQVTGSHNPKDYNGFKMVLAGRAIYGDEIQALRRQMEQGPTTAAQPGRVRNVNLLTPYRDRILQDVKLARPLEARRRFGQRHRRRFGARHLSRARLRGHRAVQRRRRQFPQPSPGPEQAGEPEGPDRGHREATAPTWAWPSTATATGWASSRAAATTSTRTGR